jgi:XTP/dITP diphosphohydrolase
MKKLFIATQNKDKLREAEAILKIPIEAVDINIDEPQSLDLEYVVKKKVEEAYRILKKPVIVDDVSFEIEAWNGFPGPLIKFLLSTVGNKKLLELLKNEKNRNVTALGAVGYHDGKKAYTFIGEVRGQLAASERGKDGWGFDFFFIPEGETKTFAELGFEKKNKLSHRRAGLEKLKEFLDRKSR